MEQQPKQVMQSKLANDQQESEWSLSSLEELKGINLNQLKEQQEREQDFLQKEKEDKQNQQKKVTPKYPPMQEITLQSVLHEVGKVLQKVGELLIVETNSCINLVDLDNWLFNNNRECMGFVIDIFGRVEHPFYAIKLLEEVEKTVQNWSQFVGKPLFYAEGCKTLTEDDLKSIKQKSSKCQEWDEGEDSSQSERDQQQQLKSGVCVKRKQLPKRKGSFKYEQPHRERTREKNHQNNNNRLEHHQRRQHYYDERNQMRDRQHNEMYLQNMYSAYHTQMMQMYSGMQGSAHTIFQNFQFQPPQ